MSDFRTTKGVLGGKTVIRKGSKYDKDSERLQKKHNSLKSTADEFVADDLAVAATMAKKRAAEGDKSRSSNDTYEHLAGREKKVISKKAGKSGKGDHKFFKHTIKGK